MTSLHDTISVDVGAKEKTKNDNSDGKYVIHGVRGENIINQSV